jgi:hypothetical protein
MNVLDTKIMELERLLLQHLAVDDKYWCSANSDWYTITYTYADML